MSQVALGESAKYNRPNPEAGNLPRGKMSVKARGCNVPYEIMDIDKVPIYRGAMTQREGNDFPLNFNEYIVYNTSQICIKYLVLVKFIF